jgi:hypothetical protein
MGDITENSCNFYVNIDFYGNHQKECEEGQKEFNADVKTLQGVRHKAGEALLSSGAGKKLKKISKELKAATKKLDAKYDKKSYECYEELDDVSCGYVNAHDQYVDALGPLSSFNFPSASPTTGKLKLENTGHPVVNLQSDALSEVLIDSGAEVSAFSKPFYNEYYDYFTFINNVPGSNIKVHLLDGLKLKVGGQYFEPQMGFTIPDIVSELGSVEENYAMAGLLGMDFLVHHPFEVDYDEDKIIFDVDVRDRVGDGSWAQIPITLDQSASLAYTISMDVYVDGKLMNLVFDTGSRNSIVFRSCAPEMESKVTKSSAELVTVYGTTSDIVDNASFAFGNDSITRSVFLVDDNSFYESKKGMSGACGMLGANVLYYLDYIVDLTTMSLFVRRRENQPDHVEDDFDLGAALYNKNGGALLKDVKEDGIFGSAGLKDGDIVIEIDGRKVITMGSLAMFDTLQSEKAEIPITYKRNGKLLKATIKK